MGAKGFRFWESQELIYFFLLILYVCMYTSKTETRSRVRILMVPQYSQSLFLPLGGI